ncbi:alcohol dehydrogenase catalytic domain-containing protein [Streptomyces sp. NBC_01261]|uniref:alcohol dehydrogenase catalytic domain-containing protein n=1 Tax=Streptomyces sp. NBC_01261 TaxID=2903802 RepID=UPI003FCC3AD6
MGSAELRHPHERTAMRAAHVLDGELLVGEVDKPTPGDGQVLVRIRARAICASGLHFLRGGKRMVELSRETGGPCASPDLEKEVVLGHEFVGGIVEYGPNSREALKVGARVVSVPVVMTSSGHSVIGFDDNCPGGGKTSVCADLATPSAWPTGQRPKGSCTTPRIPTISILLRYPPARPTPPGPGQDRDHAGRCRTTGAPHAEARSQRRSNRVRRRGPP